MFQYVDAERVTIEARTVTAERIRMSEARQ
jgi:hypothetical protein